ncbi:hypothetical protein AN958_09365 [Leucoagaricus sp. SymC.cos]|nr:hypothetical protein AN958_09365 [Leucoagaricus sp. SymC.cos]
MASEQTPLLSDVLHPSKHVLVYERFSPLYKKFIVMTVAWCGLMPLFLSGTFSPSIPQMARDLNTTGENIGLSVFATSIGALMSASYATFSRNLPELLFWRFWQCIGASPGLAIGAAVIGDIYKLEERGTGMGLFLAVRGACWLLVGAPVAGRISDRIVSSWKRKRRGVWYPEDRLRATFSGGLIFVPLSVLGCGLVTQYVEGPIGLTRNLMLLFMNGLGIVIVLSPSASYVVDVMHSRSAEAMACNAGFRSFLLTFAIAGVMPLMDAYGMLFTNAVSALLAWIGFV